MRSTIRKYIDVTVAGVRLITLILPCILNAAALPVVGATTLRLLEKDYVNSNRADARDISRMSHGATAATAGFTSVVGLDAFDTGRRLCRTRNRLATNAVSVRVA